MSENPKSDEQINELMTNDEVENIGDGSIISTVRRLYRLSVGLALIGGEELGNAMQRAEDKAKLAAESSADRGEPVDEDTEIDHLRYLALGSALRVQKKAASGIKRGLRFSLRTSGAVLGTFYALTDNRLMRPMQRPVDLLIAELASETDQAMKAGKMEEHQSKDIARNTIGGLVDGTIDSIADNPKVTNLIKEQLTAQSAGMFDMILDAARRFTAAVDDRLEGAIRRVLHLTPRSQLPESPISGKPQFMYLPEEYIPQSLIRVD
ncbi:MAG: hypothetical protein U9R58_00990 [Chloroflexota bacterium]|nr:hypothetical protein [Chloroflexota bacterium]